MVVFFISLFGFYFLSKYLVEKRQWSKKKSFITCFIALFIVAVIASYSSSPKIPKEISYTVDIPGANKTHTYKILLEEGGRGRVQNLVGWNSLRYEAYVDNDDKSVYVIMIASDILFCGGKFPQKEIYYRDGYVYPELEDMKHGRKNYGLKVKTSGSLYLSTSD